MRILVDPARRGVVLHHLGDEHAGDLEQLRHALSGVDRSTESMRTALSGMTSARVISVRTTRTRPVSASPSVSSVDSVDEVGCLEHVFDRTLDLVMLERVAGDDLNPAPGNPRERALGIVQT